MSGCRDNCGHPDCPECFPARINQAICGACGGTLDPDQKRQHDDPANCLIELRERIERLEQRVKPVADRRPFILGPGR